MPLWFSDFKIRDRKIIVKATGAELPINAALGAEIWAWFPFYLSEKFRRMAKVFSQKAPAHPPIQIAFTPVQPRPWYLISVLAYRAHMKRISDFTRADAVFYFEDQTDTTQPTIPIDTQGKAINFNCYDISKSRVAEKFEQVFGYALAVNPLSYQGPIAVKSEKNGAHDGYQAMAPLAMSDIDDPDIVYQRLIDNTVDGQWVEDMRCPCIGGEIEIIFVKRRPMDDRFANTNSHVTLERPEVLLSDKERAKLKAFAAVMGLDFGGMDVLRDRNDGKIYVVDVNKTDMGPPLALSHADKSKSVAILTKQLQRFIQNG